MNMAQPRRELIKIAEFQRRVWGACGTPLCSQAIRNALKRGDIPGEQIGKLWFVNWTIYTRLTGDELVDRVLKD